MESYVICSNREFTKLKMAMHLLHSQIELEHTSVSVY